MVERIEIEEALRSMALKNIKCFYIEYFSSEFDIDIGEATRALYEFAQNSEKLHIKYELRCINCIEIMDEFNHIEDIKKGEEIECEDCKFNNIIDSDNIYIIYYIDDEYRKKIRQLSKKNISSRRDRRKNKNMCSMPSSIKKLEELDILKVSTDNGKFNITLNQYNNNHYESHGPVGAMGDNSRANDFKIFK